MLDQHNKKQISLIKSKEKMMNGNITNPDCKTVDSSSKIVPSDVLEELPKKSESKPEISDFETIKIKNPFRELDYLCDSNSESDCEVLNRINMKKMYIMNCYLRFMRLAHIGNGLEIYWRKILNINVNVSYNQYYEMIEYKTSEILVFMIDCLCILHDVRNLHKNKNSKN